MNDTELRSIWTLERIMDLECNRDQLRAEVERLNLQRAKDYSQGCEQIHKVEQERDQLRAKLEIAKAALLNIQITGLNLDETQDEGPWTLCDIAKEALKKIEAAE